LKSRAGAALVIEIEQASDLELVSLAREGAERAFEEIVRRYSPRVFRIASRFFRQGAQVEDAAQEAFLKAYIQLSSYEGRGSLEGWLARITANQCSTKNKWQVRFAVLILFVVGFIAGGLTMNLYGRRQWSPRAGGRGGFEMMLDRLNLNEDQKTQVSAIFEDAEGNWPSCVKNPSRSSARCARVPMSG